MSLNSKSTASAIALLIGGFIGASALVALADGTWTPAPSCTSGNMPCNNAAAPINVGSAPQSKSGPLTITYNPTDPWGIGLDVSSSTTWLNQLVAPVAFVTYLNVQSGQTNVANTVLANDGSGGASWVATSTLGMGGGNVTVNGGTPSSGSVGGGCWLNTSSGGNYGMNYSCWGDMSSASLFNSNGGIFYGYNLPSCPTGYQVCLLYTSPSPRD